MNSIKSPLLLSSLISLLSSLFSLLSSPFSLFGSLKGPRGPSKGPKGRASSINSVAPRSHRRPIHRMVRGRMRTFDFRQQSAPGTPQPQRHEGWELRAPPRTEQETPQDSSKLPATPQDQILDPSLAVLRRWSRGSPLTYLQIQTIALGGQG